MPHESSFSPLLGMIMPSCQMSKKLCEKAENSFVDRRRSLGSLALLVSEMEFNTHWCASLPICSKAMSSPAKCPAACLKHVMQFFFLLKKKMREETRCFLF